MRFKDWILKEIGGNDTGETPPVQNPNLYATALAGTFSKKEEPPKAKKPTATKKYVVNTKK